MSDWVQNQSPSATAMTAIRSAIARIRLRPIPRAATG